MPSRSCSVRSLAGSSRQRQLIGAGHPLALVNVAIDPSVLTLLADLTDPAALLKHGIRPDALASRDRAVTQSISRSLFTQGFAGFRWWSALHGDWHALLLFLARLTPGELAYGRPEPLTPAQPWVVAAARELRMDLS